MTQIINRATYMGTDLNSPIAIRGTLLDKSSWKNEGLQITAAQTPYPEMYWPSVIRTTDYISNPLNSFYMYISSDHGLGGIAMFHGPSPVGPWTAYGQVYQDAGGLTETPSVIWDSYNNRYMMFYHQPDTGRGAIGSQSTLAATSTNGITWTQLSGFRLDIPATNTVHGDGHTGYFIPWLTDTGWVGVSLLGGTSEYDHIIWTQEKGNPALNWRTNYIPLGYHPHMTQGAPLNGRDALLVGSVKSGGLNYGIIRVTDGTASGAASQNGVVCIATVSSDLRQITSRPIVVGDPLDFGTSTDLRCVNWAVFDGILYIYLSINKLTIQAISHVL